MNAIDKIKLSAFVTLLTLVSSAAFAQHPELSTGKEPWSSTQLIEPQTLAATLSDTKATPPVILSVSPGPVIPGSVDIGPASEKANLDKLRTHLKTTPIDADIVLYCGCCPFNKCPNIRPAFNLLNEMGFKNHKLLNVPNNIKADWINKGYPVAKLK